MEILKIDRYWKFLAHKNGHHLEVNVAESVTYVLSNHNLKVLHNFFPSQRIKSSLTIQDKSYKESEVNKKYVKCKKRFGLKTPLSSKVGSIVFFPQVILELEKYGDLEVIKDPRGNYSIKVSPFFPKNIIQIIDLVNAVSITLHQDQFFKNDKK